MPARATATVKSTSILLETDRPELIAGRDLFGALYLCLLVKAADDGYHYVAVNASAHRLEQLQKGEIDLRSILSEPESNAPYFLGVVSEPQDWDAIEFTAVDGLRDEWLPDPGLKLTDFTREMPAEPVTIEAVQRGTPVIDDEDEGEPPMAWMPLPVLPHATDVTPPQGHDRESYTDTQDRDNYFDEDEED